MAAAPPRRVIGGRWELDKQIGKGSFAVVWRAREVPEGARVASDREATGGPREVPPAPPTASPPRPADDASFSDPDRLGSRDARKLLNCDETDKVESTKRQKNAVPVFQKDADDADDAPHSAPETWVAVKEICTRRLNRKLLRSLESEIDVLRACRHENIIALLDIIKDEENQTVFLVLEHCARGDVSEFLRRNGRVAEPTARAFARQIAGGLREMRARNLIHRDLKPQNLLLCCGKKSEEVTLKIADFGFARYVHPSGLAETLCGSPLYMAPEILSYQKYDAKADLWSVGCILFELVCGKPPFTGANPMQLLRNITRGDARVPGAVATTLSSECVDLMRGLLQKDPTRRMSFEQFFDHPFLAEKTETHQAPMRMARGRSDEREAEAPAPSLAARAGADSDSDASESETLSARDPRAIALGTDGEPRRPGDAEAERRVSASPKEKKFSLPAAAERARDAAAAAGAWLGSSPLARGGSTFSKLLSSSPLSAKKGSLASFSGSPRGTRPPRTPAKRECFEGNERGEAEDMDAEYVLVETDVSRRAGLGSGTPALKKVSPDASASQTKKKTKGVSPVLSSVRLRRAALLERAARALRDAAGEKWDAGDRLDAVALSLAATAALRRAAALAEAARRAAAAEGDDDDAEEVAEASRRLDAAFEAALRRAERAASAAETRVARTRSPSSSDPTDELGSRDENASFSDADADVVPDGMRATYAAALGWGRAAAAAELVGDAREAASTYARAHVLLSFLLSEGPDFCAFDERDACRDAPAPAPESTAGPGPGPGPDDGGSPASAWRSAEERGRVARFADAFAARRAVCLERGGV